MKTRFKVLIIGAGRIGALYDFPRSNSVLTHAHAFLKHPYFELVGFVDNNKVKAEAAAKIWGVKVYQDIEEAFFQNDIDVVCVTTSVESHGQIMKALARYSSIRLILLEKPIAKTIEEAREIIKLYERKKFISVAVNYLRDYLPEIDKIKRSISKGIYGEFINGSGLYTRGVINDSHIIDLIQNLLGPIDSHKITNSQPGFYPGDPLISAVLTLKNGQKFYLNGFDQKLPIMFEVDLFFAKQRIRIYDLGQRIETYKILPSKLFKGYKNMIKTSEQVTSLDRYMYYVAENIYRHITKKEKLKCSLADGYKVFETCDKLVKSAAKAL